MGIRSSLKRRRESRRRRFRQERPANARLAAPETGPAFAYAVALAASGSAALADLYTQNFLASPFVLQYPAILLASWYGGLGPGLLSTGLSAAAIAALSVHPASPLRLDGTGGVARLAIFAAAGVTIAVLNELRLSGARVLAGKEAAFRELSDRVPAFVWTTGPDGQLDFINDRWREYTGQEAPECLGAGWTKALHPDDVERVREAWQAAVRTGTPFDAEARIVDRTGRSSWFQVRAEPVRADGISGWFGISTNIQQRKLRESGLADETRTLQGALNAQTIELLEKVATLEAFSYTVAHDLRGPLRTLEGFSELLSERLAANADPAVGQMLRRMAQAAVRMDRLIQDVLAYTGLSRQRIVLQPVDLGPVVEHILAMYAEVRAASVKVQRPLLRVMGTEPLITMVLANLLTNAAKFVPEGRAPKLRVWTEARDARVRVFVEDNGVGVAENHRDRIFKPFERIPMDPPRDGTGIGLAIVGKAVERMRGTCGVEPGETGSRFWFELERGDR